MNRFLVVLLSLVLLSYAESARATDYFVCNNKATCNTGSAGYTDWETGNNGNAGTSRGAPWLTLDYAVDNVSAGDTIYVGKGTYNERVTLGVTGTAGNYITLRTYPAEQREAVLSGTGLGHGLMIDGSGMSYYKIIGLKIQSYQGGAIHFNATSSATMSHIEIRDNEMYDQNFVGLSPSHAILIRAAYGWPYNENEINNVIIDNNYLHDIEVGLAGDCCYTNETLTLAFNVKYFQITNNTLVDMSHIGMDLIGKDAYGNLTDAWPQYGIISGNTVTNAGNNGMGQGLYVDGAKDIVYENNRVSDTRVNYGIIINQEWGNNYSERIIIRNNEVWDNNFNLCSGGSSNHGLVRKIRIAHNTVYASIAGDTGLCPGKGSELNHKNNISYVVTYPLRHRASGYDMAGYTYSADYNMYYPSNGTFLYQEDIYGHTVSYSSFAAYQSGTGIDTNSTANDPIFTDAANDDFSLQSGSPAIDAGGWLTTIISGTGSGTSFTLADPLYFYDGYGISGVAGDTIKTAGGQSAMITSINYTTGVVTVDRSISWTYNEGVAYEYAGAKPDMGANEYGGPEPPRVPNPPSNVRIVIQ